MDTNKNSYTIIYATVLVVFVAAVLAFVSSSLKESQQRNIDIEKKQALLSSVGLGGNADAVPDKNKYVEDEYSKYITSSYIVNGEGEKVEGDAFYVDLKTQNDLIKKIAASPENQKAALLSALELPVFTCTVDGKQVYILSCYGAGLWGPIWGYIALSDDFNTIYGTTFAHKGETPGLGAEIATPKFGDQFKNKQIFDGKTLTSVAVVKGGAEPGNLHEVDAISGGTITSQALDNTIRTWLQYYLPYIEAQQSALRAGTADTVAVQTDSTGIAATVQSSADADSENVNK